MTIDFEQIESSQRQHNEVLRHQEEMFNLYEKRILQYIAILRPEFSKDGDMFCYLWRDDIQSGIAGFGKTPFTAAEDFLQNFNKTQ